MKHPPDQSLTLTSVPCQDVGQVNCTQCHYGILHENCYLTVFIHELQNLGNIGHALLTFFFSSFAIWVAHCEKRTECLLPGQHSDEGQCTDFLTGTPNLKNHLTWFREMRRKVKVRSMSTNSLQTISF